jgi:hypothetical protein
MKSGRKSDCSATSSRCDHSLRILTAPLTCKQYANNTQQAFSAESTPTLQHALPSLEKMHTSWEKATAKPHYKSFVPALSAGMAKLDEYYQWSAESDAHILANGYPIFIIIS